MREGNQRGESWDFPSVLPGDRFQAAAQEGGASPGGTGGGRDLRRWSWETRRQGDPGGRALEAESCEQRVLGTSKDQNLPVAKLTKARERSAWRS